MNQHKEFAKLAILAVLVILAYPSQAHAYIGPGAGFAVVGSFLAMFAAFLSTFLALFTWPVRYAIRSIRGRKAFARSRIKKFVILGLDGMDYALTEKLLAEGKLPNLDKLRKQGCFKPLATTVPSISPVAWSSFQTSSNPGKHNIFDFLTRDKHTYQPKLSSVDIRGPRRIINLGKYQFPICKADIRLLRKGTPFWKILGMHGVFGNVLRVPITFPPEKFHGLQLSGMCVPDLRGTQGMFSFYTTGCREDREHTGGECFHVTQTNGTIKADLIGPVNPFHKDRTIMRVPFVIKIRNGDTAQLSISGAKYLLEKNVYTEWIAVDFKATFCVKVRGICRFLLKNTEPEFELYVTPINIDPEKPVMPIAYPVLYSTYLAKSQGPFATLGLAEDSWALNENVINNDDFIAQCISTDEEREKMFFDTLDKMKRGLCVCVFDGSDRIQHMFWRDVDDEHPARNQHGEHPGRDAIMDLYQRMDELVARTMANCADKDTVLMIISDHGFNTFRYGVDLNYWLKENGYLKLKEGNEPDEKYLTAVDWSQTRAFATGLSGIFLNLKGRESQGIVDPGAEAEQLRDEIAGRLSELEDPERNKQPIQRVYSSLKTYSGPYKEQAPDLLVGFNKGYRVSWEAAIGRVTEKTFHVNTKAWSGDHCVDPALVPGILFCNRDIDSDLPRLTDIGTTVLDMFGVDVPGHMDGNVLKVADAGGTE
jgi:predicted AlkP superfamily phosphohydrolase/phosphomutase